MKYSKCAPFNDINSRNRAHHCLCIVERNLESPLLSKTAQPNAQKINTDRCWGQVHDISDVLKCSMMVPHVGNEWS